MTDRTDYTSDEPTKRIAVVEVKKCTNCGTERTYHKSLPLTDHIKRSRNITEEELEEGKIHRERTVRFCKTDGCESIKPD